MLMNPYYAITLYPGLFGEHPPMVTEDQWVAANTRLISKLGTGGVPAPPARRTQRRLSTPT